MASQIRINKYLAQIGVASRRRIDQMLAKKIIFVNGLPATIGQKITPNIDKIIINNKIIKNINPSKIYLMLNKPPHYVSTVSDDQNRPTVLDLVKSPARLYPVGRLDFNSTGLLLLTNDGDFALRMTHPRFHLPKTYLVTIKGKITPSQIRFFKKNTFSTTQTHKGLKIVLTQGKNRQIRRLCESIGLEIISLHRVSIGPLKLGSLPLGRSRPLTSTEILSLRKIGCII